VRWAAAKAKTPYDAAYEVWNGLSNQIMASADAALELRATSMTGFGVLAAAAIIRDGVSLDDATDGRFVLAALARAAGFEVPEDGDTPSAAAATSRACQAPRASGRAVQRRRWGRGLEQQYVA
jgi:hypothetical protein